MTKAITTGLIGLVLLGWAGPMSAQPVSPYADQHSREIKALSPTEVEDLVQGRGMGLAKPAELNRYPGPLHALELAGALQLSAEQRERLELSKARMSARAKAVGAEVLDLERNLDAAFVQRTIDQVRLSELTAQIGAKQGMLRAAHLEAHLETTALLTPEQISQYHRLRGYDGTSEGGADNHAKRH